MRLLMSVVLVSVMFMLAGCAEDASSEDIRTSGIYAAMDINVPSASQSDVKVSLKVGGSNSNTYIDLTGGDVLTATLNDSQTITLSKTGSEVISYVGTFSGATAGVENSTIKVAFTRPVDDDAPDSHVTLPSMITNLAVSSATFDRSAESISLTWTADGGSNLSLAYSGNCIQSGSIASVVNNGSYTINAGTLKDSGAPASCSVTFTLQRTVSGTLDTAYGEGGYIRATASRSVTSTSAP